MYNRIVSDHAIIVLLVVVAFAVGLFGLIVLGLMLRESQRLTRAVAGLVYQETDRIRSLLGRG
jgi:heme/copper-type cytochrome/quinol oxidase subunit 1